MYTKIAAMLATVLMIVTPLTAQNLPSSGIATKSVPVSGTIQFHGELVDINGTLNAVRFIQYGTTANTVALFGELAPNTTAIGRTTGTHYLTNGTVTVTRRLPPGVIPDSATVSLSFPIFTPPPPPGTTAVPDLIEYALIVNLIAYVVLATVGQNPQ